MPAISAIAAIAGAPWRPWQRWVAGHTEEESQVDQQFSVIGKSSAVSLIAALLLVIYTGIRAPTGAMLVWLACLLATVMLWLALRTAFLKRTPDSSPRARWVAMHTLIVMCMGLVWGLCIWVFDVPKNFNGSILVVTMQTAVAMTGWLFFSGFFPALLMYSLGMFVPAALAYALQGDFAHAALCLALHVVYVLQGRKVIEVIRIRHEKEGLVLQLQKENSAKQMALAAAHEATAAKTRFFAAISHDVRQPLYSLSLLVDTTAKVVLESQRRELQQRMQQSVAMLDGLFTQLLEVSQLDAGALQPRIEAVDLAAFMHETAQILQAQLGQTTHSFVMAVEPVFVLADRAWLRRIALNLIGNALNYAPGGEVKFLAVQQAGFVTLSVEDQGPGIDEDNHEKIFEEFYRGSDQTVESKGFGLGLPIVRRLARAMHTDVKLRSSVGHGSTFWLDLPLTAEPLPSQRNGADQRVEVAQSSAGLLQGAKIGVLEDDANIGRALSALLASWGAKVRWARDSHEALLWAEPVDALIVDHQLKAGDPMTGAQVAELLLSRWASCSPPAMIVPVPVLIASSLNLGILQSKGFDAVVKPLAPIKLRAWLLHALTRPLLPAGDQSRESVDFQTMPNKPMPIVK
jgi:two-component system, sensor histidine kinase